MHETIELNMHAAFNKMTSVRIVMWYERMRIAQQCVGSTIRSIFEWAEGTSSSNNNEVGA